MRRSALQLAVSSAAPLLPEKAGQRHLHPYTETVFGLARSGHANVVKSPSVCQGVMHAEEEDHSRRRKVDRATPATLAFTIHGQGGDISLKYFKPRETRAGVFGSGLRQQATWGTMMAHDQNVSRLGGGNKS